MLVDIQHTPQPEKTRRLPNATLVLDNHLFRWPNIRPTLVQCTAVTGISGRNIIPASERIINTCNYRDAASFCHRRRFDYS